MRGALSNFGRAWGTPGQTRGPAKYIEACDARGAVLPVPYGTGAGYIFSAALLHWLATSDDVRGWVADAAGPSRERLQWQKFEDTSTGYLVSHAPQTVHYVDIGTMVHDVACHPEGERKRYGDGTYRPPCNLTLLAHNLKTPTAFGYAFDHMRGDALPYEQNQCAHRVYGAPLKDTAQQRLDDERRSRRLWAQAARAGRGSLMEQHNVYLQTALKAAGLACPSCRKTKMADQMLVLAKRYCRKPARASSRGIVPSECLQLVARAKQGAP